jgi:hypothetical protein
MTGIQINLFAANKDKFIEIVAFYASILAPEFFISELRAKVDPIAEKRGLYISPSWWGSCVPPKLKRLGFSQTGRYRRSPTISRRGGDDKQWAKGVKV